MDIPSIDVAQLGCTTTPVERAEIQAAYAAWDQGQVAEDMRRLVSDADRSAKAAACMALVIAGGRGC